MKEPGNRVFRFRPIFGQDAQQIGVSLSLGDLLCCGQVLAVDGFDASMIEAPKPTPVEWPTATSC
jgi:hypothetical protein